MEKINLRKTELIKIIDDIERSSNVDYKEILHD